MAQLKSLRKSQKKNSTKANDTAAVAAPARGSAPDTTETNRAAEEPYPGIAATEQIECLPLSQPIVSSHSPPN